MILGKVYLVGAGPGDAELITVKAAKILARADVVIYDRLVGDGVLALVDAEVPRVYVGKEDGKHLVAQSEINELLYQWAQKSSCVVRLKGGDPTVFGRAYEEIFYLKEHHVETEIIPGVSAILAAPSVAGIPLTLRGVASEFAVITGHASESEHASNWQALAQIDTLVFLMAVSNKGSIAKSLIAEGRPATCPVAFIESATLPTQNIVYTTLEVLAAGAPLRVNAPATMIVGDVVNLV